MTSLLPQRDSGRQKVGQEATGTVDPGRANEVERVSVLQVLEGWEIVPSASSIPRSGLYSQEVEQKCRNGRKLS